MIVIHWFLLESHENNHISYFEEVNILHIAVIGVSHRQAPVEIRGVASFTHSKKIEATKLLIQKDIEEVMILSTCNRSEIYIASKDIKHCIEKTKHFIMEYFHTVKLKPYLFIKEDEKAIAHVYKVACGLDSIVIGEDQILGQLKEANELAMELGSTKKYLNKIVREAVTFSKKVKTQYKLSENQLSISSIGVKFLKETIKDFEDKKVLIIGTGKTGKLALKYMMEQNIQQIYVSNRTHHKVEEIIKEYPNLKSIVYNQRYDVLNEVDMVISATASPHTVFKWEMFPKIYKRITLLDLAVPRDVDPKIGQMDRVQVFTIDDLKEIADRNRLYRMKMAHKIEEEINLEIRQMMEWILKSKVDPIIRSFTQLQKQVADDTIQLILEKITMDDNDRRHLEKLIYASFKKMIKKPIEGLKSLDEEKKIEAYKHMINNLFDFQEGA